MGLFICLVREKREDESDLICEDFFQILVKGGERVFLLEQDLDFVLVRYLLSSRLYSTQLQLCLG